MDQLVDGTETLTSFLKCFDRVDAIVGPHRSKKKCLAAIVELKSIVNEKPERYSPVSIRILKHLNGKRQRSFYTSWRWAVLKGICKTTKSEIQTLTFLEQYMKKLVPVSKEQVGILHELRKNYENATGKMGRIMDGLAREGIIRDCRNPRHQRISGCPKCGVVIMGPSNNKENFVVAVDINTGSETLTLLSDFISTMWKEKREHTPVLEEETQSLEDYQNVIFHEVVRRIQLWWYVRFNLKKLRRNEIKIVKSLYYLRIRKLVLMKRMVDNLVAEYGEIDVDRVLEVYSEYEMECREYIAYVMNTKLTNIRNLVKKFISNTRQAVLNRKKQVLKRLELEKKSTAYYDKYAGNGEEEEDNYSVTLNTNKLSKKEKRIKDKIKKRFIVRLKKLEDEKFVCVRPKCNMRVFLTRDRYNTHMATMHYNSEDAVKNILQNKCKGKKVLREISEEIVLDRVRQNHTALKIARPSHLEHLDLDLPLKNPKMYHYSQVPPNSNANTPRSLYKLGIKKKELVIEGISNSTIDAGDYDVGAPPVDYQTSLSVLSHVTQPDPPGAEYIASVEDTLDAMQHSVDGLDGSSIGSGSIGGRFDNSIGSGTGSSIGGSSTRKKKKHPLDVVNHYMYSCPSFSQDVITAPLQKAYDESVMLSDEIEIHQKKKTIKQYKKAEGEILTQNLIDKLSICMPSSFSQYVAMKQREELDAKIEQERQEKLKLLEEEAANNESGVVVVESPKKLNTLRRRKSSATNTNNVANVYGVDNPTARVWTASNPIPFGEVELPDWSGLKHVEDNSTVRYTTNLFSNHGYENENTNIEKDGEFEMNANVEGGEITIAPLNSNQTQSPTELELDPPSDLKPNTGGERINGTVSTTNTNFSTGTGGYGGGYSSNNGSFIDRPLRSPNASNATLRNRTAFMQMYGKMYHLELVSFREGLNPPFKIPLNSPILKIGTLESACGDSTITCTATREDGTVDDDVLYVRDEKNAYKRSFPLIARTHCVIYVPMYSNNDYTNNITNSLIPSGSGNGHNGMDMGLGTSFRGSTTKNIESVCSMSTDDFDSTTTGTGMHLPNAPSTPTHTPHANDLCTIVDNHTFGGTYIVSISGVKKVPKKTSKGLPMHSGDLLCIGIGRVDEANITPTEASKACVVYRIRCVDIES